MGKMKSFVVGAPMDIRSGDNQERRVSGRSVRASSSQPDPALGAVLKQLRGAHGITQEDLAHAAKVAVSTLQAIENA